MSGPLSVPAAVLSFWVSNDIGKVLLVLTAFLCVWVTAYRIWVPERERVAELKKKLLPKISLSLASDCNGVRVVETSSPENFMERMPDSKWVQISVSPTTDASLIDCEALLESVERIGNKGSTENILDEPMHCKWSNRDELQVSIPAGTSWPFNLFSIHNNGHPLSPETAPHIKPRFAREIQKPGEYRLNIVVSAKDALPEAQSFVLHWEGSYDSISIKSC